MVSMRLNQRPVEVIPYLPNEFDCCGVADEGFSRDSRIDSSAGLPSLG